MIKDRGERVFGRRVNALTGALLLGGTLVFCGCGALSAFGPCGPGRPHGINMNDLDGTYGGRTAGTLTLRSDGSFVANDLGGGPEPDERPSGSGTWSLETRTTWQTDISLSFVAADGTSWAWDLIDVAGTKAKPWLWYYNGDPDSCDIVPMKRTAA